MNRRRKASWNLATIFSILVAAALSSLGAIRYAKVKNEQTLVFREKASVEMRIKVCERQTQELQIRIDQALNRYTIREQLVARNSTLKAIPADSLETISLDAPQGAVAFAPRN